MSERLEIFKAIKFEFDDAATDKERLQLCQKYRQWVRLILDNDDTSIEFKFHTETNPWTDAEHAWHEAQKYPVLTGLDHYIGNAGGLESLLDVAGIDFEHC